VIMPAGIPHPTSVGKFGESIPKDFPAEREKLLRDPFDGGIKPQAELGSIRVAHAVWYPSHQIGGEIVHGTYAGERGRSAMRR